MTNQPNPRFRSRRSLVRLLIGTLLGIIAAWSVPLPTDPAIAQTDAQTEPTVTQTEPPSESADRPSGDEPITVDTPYTPPSPVELRQRLSRIQYDVTQNEATEPAYRNAYWNNKKSGVYRCVVCELPLFDSATKFESGTGWPSFYQPIQEENVGSKTDFKMIYPRTEVHCKRCGGHLGHVFGDGPPPTGKRYCMNSASLEFVDQDR